MSRLSLLLYTVLTAGALAGPALAAPAVATQPAHDRPQPGTYLSGPTLPDAARILPQPPVAGSVEAKLDEDTFLSARRYKDTDRWRLAQQDARLGVKDLLSDFSCALGFAIDPAKAPTLVFILSHAGSDMSVEIEGAKQLWKKPRPFVGNDQPICVARSEGLTRSPSYPSGHTTLEYGIALLLSELVPDRATEILERGRTMAESRIVCGVHWVSDVQSGFVNAAAMVSALHGSEKFRGDMERARAELAALRAQAGRPDAKECSIEAEAEAHSPLFRLQP